MQREPAGRGQPFRPAIAQVTQPRRLALDADALVEAERLGDRVVVSGRVRADLLELADVPGPRDRWPARAASSRLASRSTNNDDSVFERVDRCRAWDGRQGLCRSQRHAIMLLRTNMDLAAWKEPIVRVVELVGVL